MKTEDDWDSNHCAACERPVRGIQRFSSIKHNDKMVTLCCPLCLEKFNENRDLYVMRNAAIQAGEKIRRPQKKSSEGQ